MKKEFTEEELYKNMRYIIYCIEMEKDINHYLSEKDYKECLEETDKHYGDCTKENCICIKCMFENIDIQARSAVDKLLYSGNEQEEEPIGYWKNSDVQRVVRATGILIEKYTEEFKKIIEDIK